MAQINGGFSRGDGTFFLIAVINLTGGGSGLIGRIRAA
jgi:hypothetical protein